MLWKKLRNVPDSAISSENETSAVQPNESLSIPPPNGMKEEGPLVPSREPPKSALEEKEKSELLNKLPTDLLQHMGSFFSAEKQDGDSKTLAGLARTSKRFNTLFQPTAQAAVDKILFNHIVRGEPDKVYAMLDKQPSLLLHTFTVTNPAGYTLKDRTPLQAALCCQDPQMVEEIQKRLIAHTDPKEAARQWDAQFPAGWKEDEARRWKPVFTQLEELDKTIRAAEEKDISADEDFKLEVSKGSAVEKELKEFQRLLDATQDEPIETGRMFNPHLLQELANRYDCCCKDFGIGEPKSLLIWQRIFGYAQGFLSAPDAQAFIADVPETMHALENKRPQGRNLEIKIWERESGDWVGRGDYYSCSGLGFDYAISKTGGCLGPTWDGLVGKFLSVKKRYFSGIYAAISRFKPKGSDPEGSPQILNP